MMSDYPLPVNLGTEEMISMNDFAKVAMSFEHKALPIRHIPGPEGVRGRNSDNSLVREKIGWEPSTPISEGLREVRGQKMRENLLRAFMPPLTLTTPHFTDLLLDQSASRQGSRGGAHL